MMDKFAVLSSVFAINGNLRKQIPGLWFFNNLIKIKPF